MSAKSAVTVLLIEDNPSYASSILSFLQDTPGQQRFNVAVTNQLKKGIKQVNEEKIDVIILDLELPDSHGLETLDTMTSTAQHIPIIVLTEQDNVELSGEALSRGAQDFLIKSQVDLNTLVRSIRYAIERKHFEDALNESHRKLSTLMSNLSGMVYRCCNNTDRTMEFVSENCLELTGYPASDLLERVVSYEQITHPDDRERVRQEIAVAVRENRPFQLTYCIITPSGTEKWVWERGRAVQSLGDQRVVLEGFIDDITTIIRTEGAWKETEKLYRTLFNSAGDAIFVHNLEGHVLDANRVACERLEYTHDELLYMSPLDVDDWRNAPLVTERLRTIQDQGHGVFQTTHITRSGRVIPTEINARLIDYGGQPAMLSIARDITESYKARKALEENEHKFRSVIEQFTEGFLLTDEQGLIVEWNLALEMLGGLSRQEVIGRPIWDVWLSSIAEPLRPKPEDLKDIILQILETGSVKEAENLLQAEVQRKDGEYRTVQVSVSPIKTDHGHMLSMVLRDITELKKSQDAVRRLAAIVEFSEDAIVSTSLTGTFLSWNGGATKLYGYTAEEALGQSFSLVVPPDRQHEVAYILEKIRHGETVRHLETVRKRKDGTFVYVVITASPIKDKSGRVDAVSLIVHDVHFRKQAEEALLASQRFLQSTLDALTAHITILDETGKIIAVNAAWRYFADENYLQTESYCLGQNYLALCDSVRGDEKETAQAMASGIRQILDGQRSQFHLEYSCHSPEEQRWFVAYLNCFRVHGEVRVVVAHHNITERVLAEIAEREERELAESLRDIASTLTSTLKPDVVMNNILEMVGRVVPHDAANIMLFEGTTARVAYSRGYSELFVHYFNNATIPQTIIKMYPQGGVLLVSDTEKSPDWLVHPETTWVRSYAGAPIRVRGHIVGLLNLDSSIPNFFTEKHAERLQAFADQAAIAIENAQLYTEVLRYADELECRVEQRTSELNRARERVEVILNNSSDPIILAGPNQLIRQANLAFDNTFHYYDDEFVQMPLSMLFDGQSVEVFKAAFDDILHDRQVRRIEGTARRKEGDTFDVEVGLSAIANGSDKPAVICTVRDISERKRTEHVLRVALEREKELSELKTRFVSMASHEFRTPLATIQATSDALCNYRHRMSEEQIQTRFERITIQIRHMAELLDDVLTIGRAQAGRLEFNPVQVVLNRFCREIVDEFQNMSDMTHHLDYKSFLTDECLEAAMDEKLMRQIISNLISNAIKYSPANSTVTVSLLWDQELILRITDQGIGIPEDDRKHLFEPFHRATNVGTVAGSGLGLAITKHAVELHGGCISCESKLGVGTTFTVRIPNGLGR